MSHLERIPSWAKALAYEYRREYFGHETETMCGPGPHLYFAAYAISRYRLEEQAESTVLAAELQESRIELTALREVNAQLRGENARLRAWAKIRSKAQVKA